MHCVAQSWRIRTIGTFRDGGCWCFLMSHHAQSMEIEPRELQRNVGDTSLKTWISYSLYGTELENKDNWDISRWWLLVLSHLSSCTTDGN